MSTEMKRGKKSSFAIKSMLLVLTVCIGLTFIYHHLLQERSLSLQKMTTIPENSEQGNIYPLFSFGIVADVQYADTDNGMNYEQTRRRYYGNSINILEDAIRGISNYGAEQGAIKVRPTKFILQLGDLLDGKAKRLGQTEGAMQKMQRIFNIYPNAIYHVIGNHDYYNFNRKEIKETFLRTVTCQNTKCQQDVLYFHEVVHPGVRLVVIDCYDFSILGYGTDTKSESYIQAMNLIKSKNTNDELNSSDNLPSENVHYVAFNGAVGERQLEWLDRVLSQAEKDGETVIVAGHIPLYNPLPGYRNRLWNYQEVLEVLQQHYSVVAYFCGHDHEGSLHMDHQGIHHFNVQGIIETPPDTTAYGVVQVYADRLEVQGYGRVPSTTLIYRSRAKTL